MEFGIEYVTGDDEFYQKSTWALPLALIIAGVLVYVADRWVRPAPGIQNSLFFIPMKWWTPLLVLIAVVMMMYQVLIAAPGGQ